jgi:hypothetical protein
MLSTATDGTSASSNVSGDAAAELGGLNPYRKYVDKYLKTKGKKGSVVLES